MKLVRLLQQHTGASTCTIYSTSNLTRVTPTSTSSPSKLRTTPILGLKQHLSCSHPHSPPSLTTNCNYLHHERNSSSCPPPHRNSFVSLSSSSPTRLLHTSSALPRRRNAQPATTAPFAVPHRCFHSPPSNNNSFSSSSSTQQFSSLPTFPPPLVASSSTSASRPLPPPTFFLRASRATRALIYKKVSLLDEVRRGFRASTPDILSTDPRVILADREHQHTCHMVRKMLRREGVEIVAEVERTREEEEEWIKTKGVDLVIAIGGDGTLLRASRFISEHSDLPLIGVNSAPSSSFGFFCAADHHSFSTLLTRVLSGSAICRGLWRMRVCVNGKPISPLVLNEALYCSPTPSLTTRYILHTGNHSQPQQSSGIWISTAAGSTGAIHSAGGCIQNLSDSRFQYCVRELFQLPLLYTKPLQTDEESLTQYIQHPRYGTQHDYSLLNLPRPSSSTPLSSLPPPPMSPPSPPTVPPLTGGFIDWNRFSFTNRLMVASLYIDGNYQPVQLKFNDEVSFQRSERPLLWVCPWMEDGGKVEPADNWELVTNQRRPVITDAELLEQDRLYQMHKGPGKFERK